MASILRKSHPVVFCAKNSDWGTTIFTKKKYIGELVQLVTARWLYTGKVRMGIP